MKFERHEMRIQAINQTIPSNNKVNFQSKYKKEAFDITLKQTAPKAYTGIAQKLMPDGTSQIYLLKLEHIETLRGLL